MTVRLHLASSNRGMHFFKKRLKLHHARDDKTTTHLQIGVHILHHDLRAAAFSRSYFDHGPEVPATPGWRSLIIERCHRDYEPREGDLEHHAGQGRFWLRQYRPHHDQSGFPSRPGPTAG